MDRQQAAHYAEILILVDGWPWNLSEFDFRRFFAPGCCPQALITVAELDEMHVVTSLSRVSGNRRLRDRRVRGDRRASVQAKHGGNKRAQVQALARAMLVEKAA